MKILRPYFILIMLSMPISFILSVNEKLSTACAQKLDHCQFESHLQTLLERIEKHRTIMAQNSPSKLELALAFAQRLLEMGEE